MLYKKTRFCWVNKFILCLEELRQLIKEAYEEGVVNGKSEDFNGDASDNFPDTFVAKKLEAIKYPDI